MFPICFCTVAECFIPFFPGYAMEEQFPERVQFLFGLCFINICIHKHTDTPDNALPAEHSHTSLLPEHCFLHGRKLFQKLLCSYLAKSEELWIPLLPTSSLGGVREIFLTCLIGQIHHWAWGRIRLWCKPILLGLRADLFPRFDSLHSLLLPPPHLGKSWRHSRQVPLCLPPSSGNTAFHGPVKGKVLPFSRSSGVIKSGGKKVTKF